MKRLDMSASLFMWSSTLLFAAEYAKAQQSGTETLSDYNLWIVKGAI